MTTTCCTGERAVPYTSYLLFIRCGDEWMVIHSKTKTLANAQLRAPVVEDDPDQPPSTGWRFYNFDTEEFESDESLSCTAFVDSPPCQITIRLDGEAKRVQGECEGEYEPTKLISVGRTVIIILYAYFMVGFKFWYFIRYTKAKQLKGFSL